MTTKTEQMEMYGCTEDVIRKAVEKPIIPVSPSMLTASILSDAQFVLSEMGDKEKARQLINRAKYVVFNYMTEKGRDF